MIPRPLRPCCVFAPPTRGSGFGGLHFTHASVVLLFLPRCDTRASVPTLEHVPCSPRDSRAHPRRLDSSRRPAAVPSGSHRPLRATARISTRGWGQLL